MKTSELKDELLDFWVGKGQGWELDPHRPKEELQLRKRIFGGSTPFIYMLAGVQTENNIRLQYSPSTDWSQGGPIIEREGISSTKLTEQGTWYTETRDKAHFGHGPTLLIAAMRCFVASKFGPEVDDSQAHHITPQASLEELAKDDLWEKYIVKVNQMPPA